MATTQPKKPDDEQKPPAGSQEQPPAAGASPDPTTAPSTGDKATQEQVGAAYNVAFPNVSLPVVDGITWIGLDQYPVENDHVIVPKGAEVKAGTAAAAHHLYALHQCGILATPH